MNNRKKIDSRCAYRDAGRMAEKFIIALLEGAGNEQK